MFKPVLTALCVCITCALHAQWPHGLLPNPGRYAPQPASRSPSTTVHFAKPNLNPQGYTADHVVASIYRNLPSVTAPQPPPSEPYQLHLSTVYGHPNSTFQPISYRLPLKTGFPGASAFLQAFEKFKHMLDQGGTVKEAVFTVENAFFAGRMNREVFESDLDSLVGLVRVLAAASGEKPGHAHVQALFGDTVTVAGTAIFPLRYDFSDPWGDDDFTNQMVCKALVSGAGQCHSLPLIYLILAEELGLQARLALSPGHSFIRFRSEDGRWYSFETTNGHQGSESWIMASGWIKAEALRSGIYLDTLSQHGTLVQCMVDLLQGYTVKYGYDEFVRQGAELALQASPNHLSALLMRNNYYATLTLYVLEQVGYPPPEVFKQRCPYGFRIAETARKCNRQLLDLGFVEVNREDYTQWLKTAQGGAQ